MYVLILTCTWTDLGRYLGLFSDHIVPAVLHPGPEASWSCRQQRKATSDHKESRQCGFTVEDVGRSIHNRCVRHFHDHVVPCIRCPLPRHLHWWQGKCQDNRWLNEDANAHPTLHGSNSMPILRISRQWQTWPTTRTCSCASYGSMHVLATSKHMRLCSRKLQAQSKNSLSFPCRQDQLSGYALETNSDLQQYTCIFLILWSIHVTLVCTYIMLWSYIYMVYTLTIEWWSGQQ